MKRILIGLLVVLLWFSARAVWVVDAYNVQESMRQVIANGDSYKSIDDAMAAVNVQLQRARHLNHTCVYVAECSIRQMKNADVTIDDQYKRIMYTKQFFGVYAAAKAAYKAGDDTALHDIEPQYYKAKEDMRTSNMAVVTDIKNFNLQPQIRAILAETI